MIKGSIKKIAVFRALQLGDMMCAVPAFRALRNNFPNAKITLLGLPWAQSFEDRFGFIFDRFIHFPGYGGLPEQEVDAAAYSQFIHNMRAEHFDLIIQMQGNGTIVNDIMRDWGAKNLAGFYNSKSDALSPYFLLYPEGIREVDRHLSLMKHLGLTVESDKLEFPIYPKDEEEFEALLPPVIRESYICVHPGSRGKWRQWPPQYFAAIADYCIEQKLTVVITGTSAEREITQEVIKCMRHSPIDLTGKTTLGSIALLIKNAYALVSNCTGVSHIADAMQTPSVIISMDGEPERWSPKNKKIHRVIDYTKDNRFELVLAQVQNLIRKKQIALSLL